MPSPARTQVLMASVSPMTGSPSRYSRVRPRARSTTARVPEPASRQMTGTAARSLAVRRWARASTPPAGRTATSSSRRYGVMATPGACASPSTMASGTRPSRTQSSTASVLPTSRRRLRGRRWAR